MSRPQWAADAIATAKKMGWVSTFDNNNEFVTLSRPEGVFKVVVQKTSGDLVKAEMYKHSGGSYTRVGESAAVTKRSIQHAEYMLAHKKMNSKWMKFSFKQLKIACGEKA